MAWLHSFEIGGDAPKVLATVSDRLLTRYIDRPELAQCVDALAASQKAPVETLQKLSEQNPSREVQALSLMAQIELRQRALEFDDQLQDDMAMGGTGKIEGRMSNGATDENGEMVFHDIKRQALTNEKRQEVIDRQLSMLNEMAGRFGDVHHWRDGNMQRRAEKMKHELEKLQVGLIAPPLVWTDANGEKIDLTSARGKVVVIYFWGSWCGPCKKHLPELNRMHKTLGNSLAIIGVMNEQDPAAGREAIAASDFEWPNIIEGDPGPLAEQWNVGSWPDVYILDGEGRIRFRRFSKNPNVDEIRRWVERLLEVPPRVTSRHDPVEDSPPVSE